MKSGYQVFYSWTVSHKLNLSSIILCCQDGSALKRRNYQTRSQWQEHPKVSGAGKLIFQVCVSMMHNFELALENWRWGRFEVSVK